MARKIRAKLIMQLREQGMSRRPIANTWRMSMDSVCEMFGIASERSIAWKDVEGLIGAERYERTAGREAYRAGHYDRKLTTISGEAAIKMPKLKGMRFTTAIIERYRRRETSVEEAIIEMYLARVSIRRIEDVSEILWGSSVSAFSVSDLSEKAFAAIEE